MLSKLRSAGDSSNMPRKLAIVTEAVVGGDERIRTADLCLAKAALSQLSHVPTSNTANATRSSA